MSWKAGYHSSWVGSGRYPVRVFSAVTGTAATTSGRGQMPPMVRVGRAHWRSHGATGEAGNCRPPLIPEFDAVITPCSIYRGSPTHRKPRHRPAHQPPHLPQGPRGAPCLFSWGTLRARPLSAAPVCSGRRSTGMHTCAHDQSHAKHAGLMNYYDVYYIHNS